MVNAKTQFIGNLVRVRELGTLASAVEAITKGIDVSDMWRAQIVLAVSALDYFVHELSRIGMIEISKGSRPQTNAYLKFQMPLSSVESALNGLPHETWVGETVREKHSWLSFQDPDKIADAVRLISAVTLWEAVGTELGLSSQDVKIRLKLVVERRNKIAHEADMDPANPGFRWPVNATMATDTIDFIEKVGIAIYKVI